MLWHPSPPQGFTREQGQVIVGRPVIPLFGAPQGIGAAAPVPQFLLDKFPDGIKTAYALRLLSKDYTGDSIEVRRSSDNALQNIGFLPNGDLDIQTLLNHIGGTNILTNSNDFTNADWGKLASGTGTVPVITPNQVDPFGGTDATRIQLSIGVGTAFSLLNKPEGDLIPNFTGSIFLKSNTGSNQNIAFRLGANQFTNFVVTPEWQRFSFTSNEITVVDFYTFGLRDIWGTPPSTSADILVFAPHLNSGDSTDPFAITDSTGGLQNGFVPTFFDQSGLGNTLSQVTANSQPSIATAGVVHVNPFDEPEIRFDGVDDFLLDTLATNITGQNISTFLVGNNFITNAPSGFDGILSLFDSTGLDDGSNDESLIYTRTTTPSGAVVYRSRINLGFTPAFYDDSLAHQISTILASNVPSIFLDGVEGTFVANATTNRNADTIVVGARFDNTQTISSFGKLAVSEVLVYTEDKTVDRISIEVDQSNYWFSVWTRRIPATVKAGQVPSTQSNFQQLINGTFPELIGAVAGQLRFAKADRITLEYDRQEFDPATGKLIVWFNNPTLLDGDTVYIYFANPDAVDEQNPPAVYDANYEVVLHMNQATGNILDSTVNDHDGTPEGSPTREATGKIGRAMTFDGIDDGLLLPSTTNLDLPDGMTLSIWMETEFDTIGDRAMMGKGNSAIPAYDLIQRFDDTARFAINDGADMASSSPIIINDGIPHMITGTWDGIRVDIYIDGVLVPGEISAPTIITNTFRLDIARYSDGSAQRWTGTIHNVEVSNIARSEDKIITQFNNQNDQNAFYTIGAIETVNHMLMPFEVTRILKTLPSVAYSVRQLAKNITTPFRLRNGTTQVEFDAKFLLNGDLDIADILSQLDDGADTGFLVTLYDQSGNSRDAPSNSIPQQPAFNPAGKGSFIFDNSDMRIPTAGWSTSSDRFVFTVLNPNGASRNRNYLLGIAEDIQVNLDSQGDEIIWNNSLAIETTTGDALLEVLQQITMKGGNNELQAWINGIQKIPLTSTAAFSWAESIALAAISLGMDGVANSNRDYRGELSEFIAYDRTPLGNRTDLEDNQKAYYQI